MSRRRSLSEPTPEGEQWLVPGVVPITPRDRHTELMATPSASAWEPALGPAQPDPRDEDARNQLSLF